MQNISTANNFGQRRAGNETISADESRVAEAMRRFKGIEVGDIISWKRLSDDARVWFKYKGFDSTMGELTM